MNIEIYSDTVAEREKNTMKKQYYTLRFHDDEHLSVYFDTRSNIIKDIFQMFRDTLNESPIANFTLRKATQKELDYVINIYEQMKTYDESVTLDTIAFTLDEIR